MREGDTASDTRIHKYTLNGTEILRETVYDPNMGGDSILYELYPLRDNEEAVCGIVHRVFEYTETGKIYQEIPYYFQKNLQGDVIAILDREAAIVARYSYDAWGKVLSITDKDGNPISSLSTHIANINPYRYRGYYYDTETELYYLQSRYYDANVGRFINPDDARMIFYNNDVITLSFFNYCLNCPSNHIDSSGKFAITLAISAAAGAAFLKGFIIFGFAFVTVSILADPRFQDSLADAADAMGKNKTKRLSNAVVEAIEDAQIKAKEKTSGNRYERHHIVARTASNKNAKKSRQLINSVGIGTNSSQNLVDIKYYLHRHIHTNAYYRAVYRFLKQAKNSYTKTVLVLDVIKKALQVASDACP